ncbi:carbamoyl phosphate synthase large subunit [Aureibacillus halotolerans]|uniref:Carbamoyl phosphate synthase large chain n=1 Tax=Aureibacillus halotolerans TaxID=1508390 RepID=A0A4R6UB11_9BACI|nr:carbamoyl phosphate synthase large subunit [Aureibacillus halotolerans]TDQ42109.1 carbamoyl-phosphate synthase large subunit [Aureibacillus halotolerans]
MPKDPSIKSVLVIGSGPIVIGQAAEFDYAGTQACLALKEEGVRVILVNNNPATIMTDEAHAEAVYFEPLTVESIEEIIKKEQPDGLLATLGGQTGLNLAFALNKAGILDKYGVRLLGTPIESIQQGEDREAFRSLMHELNEPVPESEIVSTVEGAMAFAARVGYPIIVRPAYTLGGSGGGIADTEVEYQQIVSGGLHASPITQCLVEKSIAGCKEVEYEVMRDANGTCITICNMENIDPVGVHTGDSIVTAPSQTLTDSEYHMLRTASIKIIDALGIIGGCNIQFALDPHSKQYYLIEVNPRVSRSSALASKATGYPIARIATKLSLGYALHELKNPVTGHTYASFEPALDYVVVKFPCWPFDKFDKANRSLGTQMKATGEVMAIERNLEAGIHKAIRSLEMETDGIRLKSLCSWTDDALWSIVKKANDRRFFAIIELLYRQVSVETIGKETQIDSFYLRAFERIVEKEHQARATSLEDISNEFLLQLKVYGQADAWLANIWSTTPACVAEKRKQADIRPSYKMVDTCAAEFEAVTPYFYSTWRGNTEVTVTEKKKVIILGSGPIRIGQGIEFDYSSVHCVLALQKAGYETIMINNNPETVSTDYEMADKLYFEPLTVEDVVNIAEAENASDVIVQFGGQTSIRLVEGLEEAGLHILGTSQDVIDMFEDRDRFYQYVQSINVPHIPGEIAQSGEDLIRLAQQFGYPVLVRPSYVIGGKGMHIFNEVERLESFIEENADVLGFPLLIDSYVPGKEAEVDLITDGERVLIPAIFEHIEKAGVHSGDSMATLPPLTLSDNVKQLIATYAEKIALNADFKGVMNIQFVIQDEAVYVLEVNPRASRTVPVISKVTGVHLPQMAAQLLVGTRLEQLTDQQGLLQENSFITIKFPVFSTMKLDGLDPLIGPEMQSTGEGIAVAETAEVALYKAFHWQEDAKAAKRQTIFIGHLPEEVRASYKEKLISKDMVPVEENFAQWLEQDSSLAYVGIDPALSSERKQALKHRLFIFSQLSTLDAFLLGIHSKQVTSQSIQQWLGETQKHTAVKQ